MHFRNVLWHTKSGTSEIYKHIEPSKEERIQNVLHKLDGSLARLMLSSAIDAVSSTICEILPLLMNVERTKHLFIAIVRAIYVAI